MSDHETENFSPYEPQTSYDWDYGDEQPRGGNNILWGRLAALTAVLLIAFFLGRASAPDGIPEEQFNQVRADLSEAEGQIDELQAALDEPEPEPVVTETPVAVDEGTEEEPVEEEPFDGQIYTVVAGDTMRGIAEEFCGDPLLDDFIADFNDIEDPSTIHPGQELKIPQDCDE